MFWHFPYDNAACPRDHMMCRCGSTNSERLHETGDLAQRAALPDLVAQRCVPGNHRVALVPVPLRLGIEPVQLADPASDLGQRARSRIQVVRAGVPDDEDDGAPGELPAVVAREVAEHVAVVRTAIPAHSAAGRLGLTELTPGRARIAD